MPLTCVQCGVSLSHNSSLTRHAKTVHGEAAFICKVCRQKFSRKESRDRHAYGCWKGPSQPNTSSASVGRKENGQASNFNATVLDDEGIKEAITMEETTMVDEDNRTVAEEDLMTNAMAIHYAKAEEDTTLEGTPTIQCTEVYHKDTVEDIKIRLAEETVSEPRTLSVNVITSNAMATSPNTIAEIEGDRLEAKDGVFEDVHSVQKEQTERQRQRERTLKIVERPWSPSCVTLEEPLNQDFAESDATKSNVIDSNILILGTESSIQPKSPKVVNLHCAQAPNPAHLGGIKGVQNWQNIDVIVCPICGKSVMWRYHMQTHTQEYRTKIACDVCNAEVLKGMLPEHMATQHFNSVWTCKKCGRKWRTSTHYYIHISRPCRQIEDLETGNGDNELYFLPDSDNENKNIVLSSTALARISADIEAWDRNERIWCVRREGVDNRASGR